MAGPQPTVEEVEQRMVMEIGNCILDLSHLAAHAAMKRIENVLRLEHGIELDDVQYAVLSKEVGEAHTEAIARYARLGAAALQRYMELVRTGKAPLIVRDVLQRPQ